jgi:hypothetical protein
MNNKGDVVTAIFLAFIAIFLFIAGAVSGSNTQLYAIEAYVKKQLSGTQFIVDKEENFTVTLPFKSDHLDKSKLKVE